MVSIGDFTAMNGQVVNDEMLAGLEASYTVGEFPAGEYSVGGVIHGAPLSLSSEGSAVLSIKAPIAMKRAIQAEAQHANSAPSAIVRSLIARHMVEA